MNKKVWTKKPTRTWENFKQKGKQNLFLEKQNVSCTLLFLWHLQKNTTTCLCGTFFTAQHNANLITWVLSNLPKSYEVTKLKISQTFRYNYQPAHPSHSSIDWVKQEQKQAKHIEGGKWQTVIGVNQLYMGGGARLELPAEEEVTTSTSHRPPLSLTSFPLLHCSLHLNHQHCSSSSHSLTTFPLLHCSLHLLDSHGNPLDY